MGSDKRGRMLDYTEPRPCRIFRATGIKAPAKGECAVCPFSHSCPQDMLDDITAKIMAMLGDYFYERNHT